MHFNALNWAYYSLVQTEECFLWSFQLPEALENYCVNGMF